MAEIDSRASYGGSVYIRFPIAVERHVQYLKVIKSLGPVNRHSVMGTKEDEDSSVNAFLDEYGDLFGVNSSQLQRAKVLQSGDGESRFYHLDQYIDGYRVFGGSIVVSLDGLNRVLGAHGHAMLESAIKDRYTGSENLGTSGVLDPITRYLQDASIVAEEYGPLIEGGCNSSSWNVETVWYRQDIVFGGQGEVNLAEQVDGLCSFAAGKQIIFQSFVDIRTSKVLALFDKSSEFAKMRQRLQKHLRRDENKPPCPTTSEADVSSIDRSNSSNKNVSTGMSRRLQVYPGLTVKVRNHNTDALLFDNSYNTIPTGIPDLEPSIKFTVATNYLFRSLSNQQWLSFMKSATPLLIRLYLNEFNAYYDGERIVIGTGLAVDDVIAHEWVHGYTDYSSGLVYSYQSGAINEAMSDIFGESLDILNAGSTTLRSETQQCTSEAWDYRLLASGSDATRRWLVGDDIAPHSPDCTLCVLRDMYYPECFGDPSTTSSTKYFCGAGDNGGVHYNSGVINRLYALIVDGGCQGEYEVTGIGLTKALNLFWMLELAMVPSTQFRDLGKILYNLCLQSVGGVMYKPNIITGASVESTKTITDSDCMQVAIAIRAVGLAKSVCTPSECLVTDPSYLGDGYCDTDGDYNTEACDWDGGDCCIETCITDIFTCGLNGFQCLNPCPVAVKAYIGDGWCDTFGGYNIEACNWDGGDCCVQSCVSADVQCGINGYQCLDPNQTPYPTPSPTFIPSALPTNTPTESPTAAPILASPPASSYSTNSESTSTTIIIIGSTVGIAIVAIIMVASAAVYFYKRRVASKVYAA